MAKVVKVTKEKLEEMKQELDYLKTTRNDEIAEQIKQHMLSEKQRQAYQSKVGQLKILFPVER